MTYVIGIDIGSTATKAVILDENKNIISRSIVSIGTGTKGPNMALEKLLENSKLSLEDIDTIIATGYGRFNFDKADEQKSELSCHAKAISYLLPGTQEIIDIGGQDIKVMTINDKGVIENFVMNDKCAAGTGRFLDTMARAMDVSINDLSDLSLKSTKPASISSTCTVFAESEVISKLASNIPLEDIACGIHKSVAHRVASLVNRCGRCEKISLSGGVAKNKGLRTVLEDELKTEIKFHPDCQLAGAIGAAIFGLQ